MKLRLFGALLVGAVALAPTASVGAQTSDTALGGYQGTAAGSALQVDYTPQGLLPLPSLIDIGSPDAVATISSGPSTFAQSSVLDPGDLLYNPDALLTLFSSQYPSGTLPTYPFRVSANSGFGEPSAESNPAPGLNATVRAEPDGSRASASAPAVQAPPLVNLGTASALATTKISGDTVITHSLTKVSGIDVFNLLTIDSVVTDLTATSQGAGKTPKLEGGTKIVGAKIAGRPVTIDGDGVHVPKSALPVPKSLGASLNDALKRAGLHITVSAPIPLSDSSHGRLASGGLRIDFDNSTRSISALAQLFDAIPSIASPVPMVPSVDDIKVALQARNVAAIELARGDVSLATTSAAIFDDDTALPVADLGADLGNYDIPSSPDVGALVPRQPAAVLPRTTTAATTNPVSPFGAGIGGLLLIALLLQPFFGQALARLSNGVLAPTGAESCDREEL
ncbi:MAG TPA: choice-of-anchor P family protein [Acidimicrobiales bacterium]|nr:choice-of-anchor P family protein [Acidimicrobiales bacterium]